MKNNFLSKSVPRGTRTIWRYLGALFILFTFAIGNVWAAYPETIWSSDMQETITGVTQTKGRSGDTWSTSLSLSWASGYTKGFQCGGSSSALTLDFNSDITVHENYVLRVYWGAANSKTLSLFINGASSANATQSPATNVLSILEYEFTGDLTLDKFKIAVTGGTCYFFKVELVDLGPKPSIGATTITFAFPNNAALTAEGSTNNRMSTITNMSTAVALTGLTTSTNDKATGCTSKMEGYASTEDGTKYADLQFTITDGYKFTPTAASIKWRSNSSALKARITIFDGVKDAKSAESTSQGSTSKTDVFSFAADAFDDVEFSGTVHIRFEFYSTTTGKRAYLESPITITGTVATAVPAATYDATFADGGHGTAPAAATGVSSVTLTELTESGWTNTGWTADKATKVGTTDKVAGATLNIGDVVTLLENTTFTAQWEAEKQTPTATFSNGTYDIAGGSALNLASLWTSNSSGAVTYTVEDANGTGAEISTASFTATTAGVAKVKAEQAANGAYSSITKYAYITVGSTADGEHTITWNAKVNTGGSTELQTASKISTSLRLTPANYAVTGLSLTSSNSSTCTDKIANTASEDADKYVSVSFTVADDYQFTPSNFDFKMVAVSKAKAIKVTISDTNGHSQSDTYEQAQNSAPGTNHTYDLSGSAYTGTVTIKIYVWRGEGVTADDGYRIGTPMTITGTVAAVGACTTPTITWNGDQPENAYVSDGSKTFVMNSNYATGIAPELSENTCGATIAVKAGTDNKQWVVSFTSAGSVKITPKVVGDGTTVCAETVSGTAKTLTVTQAYDVTFNMNGHGATIAKQVVADGAKAKAPFVTDVADWVFGGWFTDAECTAGKEFDFASTTITADIPLYAKWTADACAGDRKSLSKVVLTSASAGTVTGYNGKEYAGDAVIGGLSGTETAEVDASHDDVETGYKLNNGGSAIVFATLAKGTFQEGDKVVVTITKKQDSYKIESVSQPVLHIYYGTSKDDATKLTTLEGVSAAGSYTYRLTAADVVAIGEKKGIGVFRESSNGQNPYVYSVEIQGCRSFAVTHDVNFNMMDHGDAITKQTIEVGAKVTEPAEPEAAGYIFGGWYKENTLVNKWDFSTDVMPDNDITLYAKWADDPCTDRQSLSKVVLTAADNGTVTGYNEKEYAGAAVIASLSGTEEADIIGDATKEIGYKLSSGGNSIVFATLKKGNFQEGDKLTIGITKINDQRTIDDSKNVMTIYAGSDKSHVMEVATLTGVSTPGFYTYRLTAADATAINTAGYKSIGLFRASSNGQNHHVYSVEITGCREWAVYHTLTFKNIDGTANVATESLAEGAYASTVAPTAPKIALKRFLGWAEAVDGTLVDLASYTITTDKILYAVYEDIDCTGAGVKFSMTPVANELSSDYQLSGTTEQSINEYVTVSGGELFVNNNNASNNRVRVSKETSAIQLVSGDEGYIHVVLDCPLKENDVIRFDNTEKLVLALNSSKTDPVNIAKNVHSYVVPASWEDKDEFYIWRNGSACTISSIEAYRPAVFTVSFDMKDHGSAIDPIENVLEGSKITAPTAPTDADYSFAGWYKENTLENAWDFNADVVEANMTLYAKWLDKSDATLKSLKYGTTEIELQAGVYTYAVELPSLTTSVPALTAETSNPNASAVITDDDAFDGEGNASSTVEITPEKAGAAHLTYTVNFTKLPSMPLLDVDNSIVWDFANAGTQNNTFTDEVLANFPSVTNNATFRAQTLKASGAKIKDGYLQGTPVLFHATKAGLLRVEFANTGGGTRPYRYLVINGARTTYKSNNTTHVTTAWIEVPAGDVTIEGECVEDANGACTSDNLNFYKIEFLAIGHERAGLVVGDLGTVCLPNASIARGVTVYEYQGADAIGKIVFDGLGANDTLAAGKPYIFQVNETNARFFYTTDAAAGSPDNSKALKGNLDADAIIFQPGSAEAAHVYFVKDHAFWMAKNTGVKIGQYRCYLQMDEVQPVSSQNPAPGRRRIVLGVQGEQVATGIDELNASEAPVKVMIDGQLFIIRGEKMYNANGQLVK